jgi:hypothetical protein
MGNQVTGTILLKDLLLASPLLEDGQALNSLGSYERPGHQQQLACTEPKSPKSV